jgi:hypothetical protein
MIPVAEALKKGNVPAPRESKKGDARGRQGGKAIVIYGFGFRMGTARRAHRRNGGNIVFNGGINYII